MRLKSFKGYRGFDFDGKAISAEPGGEIACSDRRGARLLADFPGGFEVVGVPAAEVFAAAMDSVESPPASPQPRKRGRPRK
jgi:hypothetical protein